MCVDGQLVVSIADVIRYWISCQDVQLQLHAVKVVSNLSLMQSQRIAVAEAVLNSIIGQFSFCHL